MWYFRAKCVGQVSSEPSVGDMVLSYYRQHFDEEKAKQLAGEYQKQFEGRELYDAHMAAG